MRRFGLIFISVCAWAASAAAQRPGSLEGGARPQPSGRRGGRSPGANRIMIEREIRQRLAQRAKEVVGLSDEQMGKLEAMDRELSPQRETLLSEDMQTRQALRRAMADSANVDQARISDYTSKLIDIQRRRADLLDAEQKQLGTFMTPLQRAKYLALEEQVRRLVNQRLQNAARAAAPPP